MEEHDEAQDWLIQPHDFMIDRIISEEIGSTAIVYLAHFNDGKEMAVKEMRDTDGAGDLAIHRELSLLTSVEHPNIVKLYGIVENQCPVQLCLEYCGGGSLFELLHLHYQVPLCWKQRLAMLYQSAVAMHYLHSMDPPIVHRDLKSLNILLLQPVRSQHDEPHIKVCDFGFAREYEAGVTMTRGAGTMQWMAPEVSSNTNYTQAADIFSFAIVGFEVVCRRIPSIKDITHERFHWAIRQGRRPDINDPRHLPAVVPDGLIDLIVMCWDGEPSRRPRFDAILHRLAQVSHSSPDDIMPIAPPTGVESI